MKRYELTKEQWDRIKPMLPPEETGKRGRPRKDNRTMLNGMLWIVRSGAQWRELPEAYGPWQSVYARFAKWRDDGTTGKGISHTFWGCRHGEPERRLYLHKGTRKCQRWEKKRRIRQLAAPEAG